MNALMLVLSFCCQDPVPAPAAAAPTLDVVVLKNGDRFEGRITAQLDGYVELQLEAGASVGLSMAQVAEVRRGAGAEVRTVPAVIGPSDEWFVLHDGSGAPVGWLHAAVTNAADGSITIHEEYEFASGRARYQITSMCTADAQWQPRSCYFRERKSDPLLAQVPLATTDAAGHAQRIVDERIVEATRDGERLRVVRLDRSGRREREFDFAAGATFPLLARAMARSSGTALENRTLFDPASEELVVRSFDGARNRRVTIDGKQVQVTEVAECTAAGRNSEWLDASSRTLRRELAGPALVAVASSAESVRHAAAGAALPSAVAAEAGGTFGLWVPNPAWQVHDGMPAGHVSLHCEAHAASIGLSRLDHLEPKAPLDTAADAIANWFSLLHPDLKIESRQPAVVRERAAIRLLAKGRSGKDPVQAAIDVIPHRDSFLVLVCRAPVASWAELEADFAFVRRSIELEPQSLAPKLQGPLAPPAVPRTPRPAAGKPQSVRIPGDQ